jgi:amylosucrase
VAQGKAHDTEFDRRIFDLRMERSHADLFGMLERLYGERADYPRFCAALIAALEKAWGDRPTDLKWLDLKRDLEPDWFQRPEVAGYVFYLDRFNRDLKGVLEKLDYLQALGITYVHFMPCLKPRPGDSDGGYSVMDYRSINPAYGTMEEFETVARALRERGISLCIDLVLNHTAKEHSWAVAARSADRTYHQIGL